MAAPSYQQGIGHFGQGDFEQAERCLRAAAAEEPGRADCHLALGVVLERRGRLREAIDCFEQALRIAPRAEHHAVLATTYRRLPGRPCLERELEHLQRACALAPDSAAHHDARAGVLCALGRHEEAAAAARRAIDLAPGDPRPWHSLGLAAMFRGQHARARDFLERSNELAIARDGARIDPHGPPRARRWHAEAPRWEALAPTAGAVSAGSVPEVRYRMLEEVRLEPEQATPYDAEAVYDGAYLWIGGSARIFANAGLPEVSAELDEALLLQADPDNYYHWLAECLPQLLLLARRLPQARRLPILVAAPRLPGYMRGHLELLGFDPRRLVSTRSGQRVRYRVGRLHQVVWSRVSELPEDSEPARIWYPPAWVLRELREALRSALAAQGAREPRRDAIVYVARGEQALRRAVRGETRLIERLQQDFGSRLRVFRSEGLDVAVQMRVFASASVVVGAHGAGLTNLLSCDEGAQLVELPVRPPVLAHYRHLAAALGLGYRAVPELSSHFEGCYEVDEARARAVSRAVAELAV